MPAGTYDITIEQGTTFDPVFVWQDEADPPNPIDVTGYTARMQVRPTVDSSTVLVDLTTANGKIVLGGANGQIQLVLTAVETAAFAFTQGVYDLEVVTAAGRVTRLLEGAVTVDAEVTR